jgi:DNA-directed RNA polymerase specialized sigma24 family protein
LFPPEEHFIAATLCQLLKGDSNMDFHAEVAAELPLLRRYARTLTGTQTVGDAAVRKTLETIIENPGEVDADVRPRLELYRIFHKVWASSSLRPMDRPGAVIGALPRLARKALLLTTIEGFSAAETAYILGTAEAEIVEAVAGARSSINAMLAADVMIIEDEPIIALHLKKLVGGMGHFVRGIVRTHAEAVRMAKEVRPEMVLADISLADGSSGVDAVKDILELMDVPVVFITAFPERLLTGQRPEPTYLISKPFEPEVVAATIWQALIVHRESAALAHNA